MAKKKLRNIVVDEAKYLWVFIPRCQLLNEANKEYQCCDEFRAYAADNRASPLRIIFITWEDAIVGGPLHTGIPIIPGDPDTGGVNLHTPKWATALIREGIKRGWQANAPPASFTIENGVELLAELNYKPD